MELGQVFGLCSTPIIVLGSVNVEVDLGDRQVVTLPFKVIDTDERIFILGSDFMSKFDSVEFDWENCKERFGSFWKKPMASYKGGSPWDRSVVAECSTHVDSGSVIHFDINPELDYNRQEVLTQLLWEFMDVFALDPKKPTQTNLGEHVIDTNAAQPVKQPLRRIPPKWEDEANRQVGEMLRNGICRPSKSPWNSSIILVKKKDRSMRFAIDYRALNDLTKKDSYAMPDPRTILDKLQGSKVFSFLDVESVYWCVRVREDIEKTAFSIPRGHYETLVMPFGLCNSQSTFQRVLDTALAMAINTESYVDDCLTHSTNWNQHLEDLRAALSGLRDARIQLRRVKCRFGYDSGEFLGHTISALGRAPSPSLVKRANFSPRQ